MLSILLLKNKRLKIKYIAFLNNILFRYIKNVQLKKNSLYLKTLKDYIYIILIFLKKHTLGQFKILTDILCYDYPGKKFRFSIVYNLLSLDLNYRIKVFTKLKEKIPLISTITPLYSGAGWLEREVWDMFGIFFLKNNDLRRILTDYGFVGYPLRKDFPLTGFIEVIYDDSENQVVYKRLDLSQDFRNYKFENSWKE